MHIICILCWAEFVTPPNNNAFDTTSQLLLNYEN